MKGAEKALKQYKATLAVPKKKRGGAAPAKHPAVSGGHAPGTSQKSFAALRLAGGGGGGFSAAGSKKARKKLRCGTCNKNGHATKDCRSRAPASASATSGSGSTQP